MEVIAGHFSRLEYVSGGAVVITFPREVVNFVRNTVCAPQPDGVSGQYQQRTFAGIGDATNAGFLDTQLPSYNAVSTASSSAGLIVSSHSQNLGSVLESR